ncbi:class II glutamine amidotransferase [Humidisolicoccus flavus]|uniref:class II glutamine amidotransferase n=1 Tax=Humidisolicoccus flavus TaxID=3111414 RepID=UPI003250AFC7
MCRMLGFASRVPRTTQEIVGPDNCAAFHTLSSLHSDGWGTAWIDEGSVRRYREPVGGASSRGLSGSLADTPSIARIAHLRLATVLGGNHIRNTHPFRVGDVALIHNGSIGPVAKLRSLVRADELERVGGTTDTAAVFALILRRIDSGATVFDAVTETVEDLSIRFPGAALNLFVLTPQELIAVHAASAAPAPKEALLARGFGRTLPPGHEDDYYNLSFLRTEDAVAFASSGIETEGWETVPPESAIRVDLHDLSLTTRALETVATAHELVRPA